MNSKYYIWGTGYMSEQINLFCSYEMKKLNIVGYIDNDKSKEGETFFGKKIYSPKVLENEKECKIIIAINDTREVRKQIVKDYPWLKEQIVGDEIWNRLKLITRYEKSTDIEIKEIVDYIEKNPLQIFNYNYLNKYKKYDLAIEYDEKNAMYYVVFSGKPMYFSRKYKTKEMVREYYYSICIEQDIESPHRYLLNEFDVEDGNIIVDAGVAEGNFTLSVIDKISKAYLFEPDEEWIEALSLTFADYKDKVVIINKCLSNYVNIDTTTIDECIKEKIDFIKMDIEGEEYYALEGAKEHIRKAEHMKAVICTYHQEFAYQALERLLNDYKFRTCSSTGYMWYPDHNIFRAPVLRRGLIRGVK